MVATYLQGIGEKKEVGKAKFERVSGGCLYLIGLNVIRVVQDVTRQTWESLAEILVVSDFLGVRK